MHIGVIIGGKIFDAGIGLNKPHRCIPTSYDLIHIYIFVNDLCLMQYASVDLSDQDPYSQKLLSTVIITNPLTATDQQTDH